MKEDLETACHSTIQNMEGKNGDNS